MPKRRRRGGPRSIGNRLVALGAPSLGSRFSDTVNTFNSNISGDDSDDSNDRDMGGYTDYDHDQVTNLKDVLVRYLPYINIL
jgi:hypothetical protein